MVGPSLLDVPFFANDGDGKRCMQVAARMALAFFGREVSTDEIDQISGRPSDGWTWSVQIVEALHKLGAQVMLHTLADGSAFLGSDEDLRASIGEQAYRVVRAEADPSAIRAAVSYCAQHGLRSTVMNTDDLKRALDARFVPLVLIDYNVLIGKPGFAGHMIPLVGYDETGFFYHESGPLNAQKNAHVSFEAFEHAWFAPGTDRDAIIVSGMR